MERLTSKLKQPFYNKSTSNMITRSKLSTNNATSKENNDDKLIPTDYNTNSFPVNDLTYGDADSWDEASESDSTTPSTLESIIAAFCNVSQCSTGQVIDVVQNLFNIPIDNEAMEI